jgi:hypothetical protein
MTGQEDNGCRRITGVGFERLGRPRWQQQRATTTAARRCRWSRRRRRRRTTRRRPPDANCQAQDRPASSRKLVVRLVLQNGPFNDPCEGAEPSSSTSSSSRGHMGEIQALHHLWPVRTDRVRAARTGSGTTAAPSSTTRTRSTTRTTALDGHDRPQKSKAERIVGAEEAVAETPMDNLERCPEKFVLDCVAEGRPLHESTGWRFWAESKVVALVRGRSRVLPS